MTTINQKDYLKKYLGIGKAPGEKRKKKKKEKNIGNKLKIIDDDSDALISQEIQDDIAAANEDAPQIVAVIDERPPSLRIDEQTKSNLWTPIGETSNINNASNQSLKLNNSFKVIKQSKANSGTKNNLKTVNRLKKDETYKGPLRSQIERDSTPKQYVKNDMASPSRINIESNSSCRSKNILEDNSPPRKRNKDDEDLLPKSKNKEDCDYSPPRRRYSKDNVSPPKKERYDDTYSPRRKQKNCDYSPKRRINKQGNLSPSNNENRGDDPPEYLPTTGRTMENVSPLQKKTNNEDDNSPPRRKNPHDISPRRRYGNDDNSPPRRKHSDHSYSPRNKNREHRSAPRREYECEGNSPSRSKIKTVDRSPRKNDREEDSSPPRRKRGDKDISPPRMSARREEADNSPHQKNRQKKSRWGKWSPEASPERSEKSDEKMRKTLDGKKAGLQNAKDLVKETTLLRQREDEMFKKLSADVSGMNAATVVRGKKVTDLEEEARRKDNEKKTKEKYDRWGKGLKQVEDQHDRIAEQLHEMSKPLARYADDEDLEKYLKEQEREGDPMLAYIRKKKKKEVVAAGTSEKPVYLGEFLPNRFGISPGYRWDGVDRSNGYETKWFQVQNSKRATQEEAFKWSTEDM